MAVPGERLLTLLSSMASQAISLPQAIFLVEVDIHFEQDLIRNTYQPKLWLKYIEHKRNILLQEEADDATIELAIINIYERALMCLPGSYKLWKLYLDERRDRILSRLSLNTDPTSVAHKQLLYQATVSLNNTYERALVFLHKFPRIWLDYISFLMKQRRITKTRLVLDEALRALPLSQHDRIWEVYIKFSKAIESSSPFTSLYIWQRYYQVCIKNEAIFNEYFQLLSRCKQYKDSLILLCSALKSKNYTLSETPLPYEEIDPSTPINLDNIWEKICQLVVNHGEFIEKDLVEKILRTAIGIAGERSTFSALQGGRKDVVNPILSTGFLWSALAMYYVKRGLFESARQIYEESLLNVTSVRDFGLVFDAYTKFEESLLAADLEASLVSSDQHEPDAMPNLSNISLRLARFENLLAQRQILLSNVKLCQQPHKVDEWLSRVNVVSADKKSAVFEKAISSINPKRAKGSLAKLWSEYARHFESLGQLDRAKDIFEKATNQATNHGLDNDTLAEIWIEYAEFTRRNFDLSCALDLLYQRAALGNALEKSVSLWNYAVDLEESRGLVEAVSSTYDQMMRLGVATIQNIINYALFLESQDLIEASFKVFERGIGLFGWPGAFELWNLYLPRLINQLANKKGQVEQVRDLFEQAINGCPGKFAKPLFLLFCKFEEEYGLSKGSLRILERAIDVVPLDDRAEIYDILLSKTEISLGILATRSIYESALTKVPLSDALALSCRYAGLETRLGEFDRARAIYGHGAILADPRIAKGLWHAWHEFEVAHGNEDSFREMLRVKRSVTSKYAHTIPTFVQGEKSMVAHGIPNQDADDSVNQEEIQLDV